MNKYEKLYSDACRFDRSPSWLDVSVRALAADIEEETGQRAEVSGPFGLRAECRIYLNKAGEKDRRLFLTVTPWFRHENGQSELLLYYDTGSIANRYAPGTLGDLNGINNEMARLPETLDEIISLFRTY